MSFEIDRSHVGYYTKPDDKIPAQDPMTAPCLICGKPWTSETVRTFSVMPTSRELSMFYRVHRACDDAQTEEERTALDTRVMALFVPVGCFVEVREP